MAAGTALDAMAITTADDAAAQEFARVVQKHRPQIFRFLLASTRDVDLAETLTQECFLKAHRNWASFRGDSSAMTWLMRIAINLQKDHWRNRRMQFWRTTRTNGGPGRSQRMAAQRGELGGATAAGARTGGPGVERR
jgi:DNA-directed RNA polymerase specialized sigma24 family protein